jgi:PAS domain S-box-containing protein
MWRVWVASHDRSGMADYVLALGAVGMALLGRWLLGGVVGASAPFVLTFSVLLPIALLVRPAAVVAAALAGWLGSWFLFIEPRHSFQTDTLADAVLVALFGLAVVMVIVAARIASSSRLRAEEAQARSEAQFRRLADTMPQLAWYANPDGYITWFNRRWYEYTGSTPAEMEGWGWQRVHDPDVLPLVRERWTASLASGEPFDMAFPLRGADGTFRPFLTRVMPLRDEQGRVVQWFGTNTDISDQKRVEDTLREREERYRSLFEGNPHPMWVYDLETLRFLAVNDAAVAHYGYSREEFLAMTLADIRPSADVPRLLEQARAELPALRRTGVWRHLTRAGGEIDVETTVHRLEFDGRPAALVLAHDITERLRTETALRESEARFRRLADAMPQMVWIAGPDGALTFFNRQWFEFTGADAPGSLGEGWVQVVHPDDRARSLARWRRR